MKMSFNPLSRPDFGADNYRISVATVVAAEKKRKKLLGAITVVGVVVGLPVGFLIARKAMS